ncbi:MAG TPA: hypothetical protein VKE69_13155 [Planctomycetota bacterium]|nr:hypothetical protein [Planctomycetota bacterium]
MGIGAFFASRTFGAIVVAAGVFGGLELAKPRRTVVQELDPVLGWRMLPSQHAFDRHLNHAEDVNSFGFRGPEWRVERTPGVARIACLGSSMTFGSTLAYEDTYPAILERLLGERGTRVEILNFAVQGYMLEQSLRSYRVNVRRFRPDVVLLAIADQEIKPMETFGVAHCADLRPWLVRTEYYRRVVLGGSAGLPPERPLPPSLVAEKRKKNEELNAKLAGKPASPELAPLWYRARDTMESLRGEVAGDGARLAITVLCQRPQALGLVEFGPDVVWRDFAKGRERCEYVDVVHDLQTAMKEGELYQTDDPGHFAERGMRVIAAALARELPRLLPAQ